MADEECHIEVVVKTTNTKETIKIEPNATIREVAAVSSFNSGQGKRKFALIFVYIYLVQRKGFAKVQ